MMDSAPMYDYLVVIPGTRKDEILRTHRVKTAGGVREVVEHIFGSASHALTFKRLVLNDVPVERATHVFDRDDTAAKKILAVIIVLS
jgi:hypothetical protein